MQNKRNYFCIDLTAIKTAFVKIKKIDINESTLKGRSVWASLLNIPLVMPAVAWLAVWLHIKCLVYICVWVCGGGCVGACAVAHEATSRSVWVGLGGGGGVMGSAYPDWTAQVFRNLQDPLQGSPFVYP